MVVVPPILAWIEKYGIKTLINAPCAGGDCGVFQSHGIERTLGVNISDVGEACETKIQADLCYWKPSEPWDAVYINCIFCTTNASPEGTNQMLAENYADWPVRYIIVYDTAINPFDWGSIFQSKGWMRIECMKEDGSPLLEEWATRCEVWEHAT